MQYSWGLYWLPSAGPHSQRSALYTTNKYFAKKTSLKSGTKPIHRGYPWYFRSRTLFANTEYVYNTVRNEIRRIDNFVAKEIRRKGKKYKLNSRIHASRHYHKGNRDQLGFLYELFYFQMLIWWCRVAFVSRRRATPRRLRLLLLLLILIISYPNQYLLLID